MDSIYGLHCLNYGGGGILSQGGIYSTGTQQSVLNLPSVLNLKPTQCPEPRTHLKNAINLVSEAGSLPPHLFKLEFEGHMYVLCSF